MSAVSSVTVYAVLRPMSDALRPAQVFPEDGVTVVFIDPRTTCVEAAEWCVDNLTTDERNHVRAAYGQPEIGRRMSDDSLDGMVWLPESLTPPGYLPSARTVLGEARRLRVQSRQLRAQAEHARRLREAG